MVRGRAKKITLEEARTFIAEIQTSSNTLALGNIGPGRRAWYRRLHAATLYHDVLPDGMRLRYTGRDSGDMTIHRSGESMSSRQAFIDP